MPLPTTQTSSLPTTHIRRAIVDDRHDVVERSARDVPFGTVPVTKSSVCTGDPNVVEAGPAYGVELGVAAIESVESRPAERAAIVANARVRPINRRARRVESEKRARSA